MTDLAAQQLPLSGLQPAYTAAAVGGDTAPIGQRVMLHVKNGGAGPITVTVVTSITVGNLAVDDGEQTIPAGEEAFIPMAAAYRDATGRAAITYDDVTSVDVAVLQLP